MVICLISVLGVILFVIRCIGLFGMMCSRVKINVEIRKMISVFCVRCCIRNLRMNM